MVQKGRSLHIGLNHVDTGEYQKEGLIVPELNGCINDARSMQLLAANQGFITQSLTDDQATSSEVVRLVSSFARELDSGDIFLLTFSGHGGQVDDVNGDEEDGKDETWVLWDRMLIDDELYQLFGQFKAGVRIFMLSDSCHSGTVARMVLYKAVTELKRQITKAYNDLSAGTKDVVADYRDLVTVPTDRDSMRDMQSMSRTVRTSIPRFRGLTTTMSAAIYRRNKRQYDTFQFLAGRPRDAEFTPSLILISGCQDNQESHDGDENGLFTQTLLQVWNDGAFDSDYRTFLERISANMPSDQTPNFFTLGDVSAFAEERPFAIKTQQFSPSGNVAPSMWVIGDENKPRTGGAPDFQIDTQGAPYYVVEFATQLAPFGGEKTSDSFYGSWNETPVYAASNGFYPMPNTVWNALNHAERIYFRVGTTTSETGYENYRVSTNDDATDGQSISVSD